MNQKSKWLLLRIAGIAVIAAAAGILFFAHTDAAGGNKFGSPVIRESTGESSAGINVSGGAEAKAYGNTSGNLANGGFIAESGGWIYYNQSIFLGSDDDGLYKMRADGSEKTKLIDGLNAGGINVADGWVYFRSDGLCKMRTDGTDLSKLTSPAFSLCMEDGWLYYGSYGGKGESFSFYLCKICTDGTGLTKLTKGAADITVADGWVYYSNKNDNYSLNKIRVDGTDETKLSDKKSFQITVSGDYVYFITSGKEEFHSDLYRIRSDGTDEIKLSGEVHESFNVSNGWIYYCNIDDKCETSLHKMRTDGTGDVKISDTGIIYSCIAGDWIYYYNNGLYRMKTDGTENQRVE